MSNLIIPKKYSYCDGDGRYYVISQKFEINPNAQFTLEEIKQLRKFAIKLKWIDCHGGNFFKTTNGKIVLCDTETAYMLVPHSHKDVKRSITYKLLWATQGRLTDSAFSYMLTKREKYSPDATN